MRSATREALSASRSALPVSSDAGTGRELLAAARLLAENAPLRSALADPAAAAAEKQSLVARVFASLGDDARTVLRTAVASRWSSGNDLVTGIEELGIRAIASTPATQVPIEDELFAFASAVSSDAELELALSSKLASGDAKADLVARLLEGKTSEQSVLILQHLVRSPRGRRIGQLVRHAADLVADQAGLSIARITSASPLTPLQITRLTAALSAQYGVSLRIHQVVDPSVLGGLRVQIGDEVIDGTVASRLDALRLQLAG